MSWALGLEYASIIWGVASAAWSITAGVLAGSLGVLALGLEVAADVAGSVTLVWRFRLERNDATGGARAEARATWVVAAGLGVVAIYLAAEAVHDLAAGSAPGESLSAMISAGAAVAVQTPLGMAKWRVGSALNSHALQGDAALTVIGAGLGALALVALVADRTLGWWWADRVAALAAALVAAQQAGRVLSQRRRQETGSETI